MRLLYKYKLAAVLLTGLIAMFFLALPAQAAGTTDIKTRPTQTIDDAKKVWQIRFNMPIDPASINSDCIYIAAGSNRLETRSSISDTDSNVVYVMPLKEYEFGQTYKLVITNQVTSKKGHRLTTPIAVPFTLVDKSAKIQHITCDYSPFLTYITVWASPDVHSVKIGTADEMHLIGNNTFTLGLIDLKKGTTLTVRAYDENNRLMETKKYTP